MRHPLSKFSAVLMHAALAAAAGLASLPGHAADGAESLTYPNIMAIFAHPLEKVKIRNC